MNKKLIKRIRLFMILLAITGALMAFVLMPICWYFTNRLVEGGIKTYSLITLVLNELFSLPCFIILLFGYRITKIWDNDDIYNNDIAVIIKNSAKLLFISSILFIINNLVYACIFLGLYNDIAIYSMPNFIYAVFGVIGLSSSILFFAGSKFIMDATNIKKENEEFV